MIISHRHKFIYLAPVKTGTTSIEQVLSGRFNAFCYQQWIEDGVKTTLSGRGKHVIHVPKRYEDYFVFCSVRNPYTRLISQFRWWKQNKKETKNFKWFLEKILPMADRSLYIQLRQDDSYIPPKNCVHINIDTFIKLENLTKDFANLPFVVGFIKMPYLNKKEARFNKIRYTKETSKWVQKYRHMDFELFNYSKECPKNLLQ